MKCLFIGGCADGQWHDIHHLLGPVRLMEPWNGGLVAASVDARCMVTTHTYVPWIHRIYHEHEHWLYRFEGLTENQAFNRLISGYSGETSRCKRCRVLNPIGEK